MLVNGFLELGINDVLRKRFEKDLSTLRKIAEALHAEQAKSFHPDVNLPLQVEIEQLEKEVKEARGLRDQKNQSEEEKAQNQKILDNLYSKVRFKKETLDKHVGYFKAISEAKKNLSADISSNANAALGSVKEQVENLREEFKKASEDEEKRIKELDEKMVELILHSVERNFLPLQRFVTVRADYGKKEKVTDTLTDILESNFKKDLIKSLKLNKVLQKKISPETQGKLIEKLGRQTANILSSAKMLFLQEDLEREFLNEIFDLPEEEYAKRKNELMGKKYDKKVQKEMVKRVTDLLISQLPKLEDRVDDLISADRDIKLATKIEVKTRKKAEINMELAYTMRDYSLNLLVEDLFELAFNELEEERLDSQKITDCRTGSLYFEYFVKENGDLVQYKLKPLKSVYPSEIKDLKTDEGIFLIQDLGGGSKEIKIQGKKYIEYRYLFLRREGSPKVFPQRRFLGSLEQMDNIYRALKLEDNKATMLDKINNQNLTEEERKISVILNAFNKGLPFSFFTQHLEFYNPKDRGLFLAYDFNEQKVFPLGDPISFCSLENPFVLEEHVLEMTDNEAEIRRKIYGDY